MPVSVRWLSSRTPPPSRHTRSECTDTLFTVPNAHCAVDFVGEDLAVPDSSRSCSADDRVCCSLQEFIFDDNLEFDLRQQIDFVFVSPINLGMTFLAPMSSHFRSGHAIHTDF